MRRLALILVGLLILVMMLGLLFFSGAIYDAEKKYTVETFFFEPNSQSERRIKPPVSAGNIPDKVLRELIIRRFVNEYFYVIPDVDNANKRQNFRNTDGTETALWGLSADSPKIYTTWAETVAPEIIELAGQNALRIVEVTGISESESGHLVVDYVLKTWTKPNDVMALPELTMGALYLDIKKQPVRVKQSQEALDRLKNGVDPVSAFTFEILDVVQK